ncbi:hypothetical protein PMAYCL1PPCAC_05239, partial [Pristionchus mayeri]
VKKAATTASRMMCPVRFRSFHRLESGIIAWCLTRTQAVVDMPRTATTNTSKPLDNGNVGAQ